MISRPLAARRPGAPLALAARAADGRRRQRRPLADTRLYCATNGCTTHLELDAHTGVATCPVCGFIRRLS